MEAIKKFTSGSNLPRAIITLFFLLLCVIALVLKMPFTVIMSDILIRYGMNGVLVLAMVPAIQCGIGPNFGLPIGIIAGLLGILVSMEWELAGASGFVTSILVSIPIAIVFGVLFGAMLNRIKGSEMIVSTYTGFSVVSVMSIAWLILPFENKSLGWPLGPGLRNVVTMENSFGELLNNFLSWRVVKLMDGSIVNIMNQSTAYLQDTYGKDYQVLFHLPTGLILFFFISCYLVYLFVNSKTGVAMKAVGDNQNFARASGINVDRQRLIGTTLSTVLGAIGIIIYSQSFGYIQLYQAPLMMAFPAVAAILIGGASAQNASISHVVIGTFLFNAILTISLPVANQLLPEGNLSEVLRMIIQNGVILYALTKVAGGRE